MHAMDIVYVGNDIRYWEKIVSRYTEVYPHLSPNFFQIQTPDGFDARDSFIEIYRKQYHIIYLDFSNAYKEVLVLAKLLARNNAMRQHSVVGLHDYAKASKSLDAAMLSSVRLNHIKSKDIHDVVYDPIALLNVDLSVRPPFVTAKGVVKSRISLPLRISYITKNHIHIETNAGLPEFSFITINSHPLKDYNIGNRFFVTRRRTQGLYYNTRYAYDLLFTFVDDEWMRATEYSYLVAMAHLPEKNVTTQELKEYEEDIVKRELKTAPFKKIVADWVDNNKMLIEPKRVKVLVVDESLDVFRQIGQMKDKLPYAINVQTYLTADFYQIKRTIPHLIVFHYDEKYNNENAFEKLVSVITEIDNYAPYILFFNTKTSSEVLRQKLNYQNLVSYSGKILLKDINAMASKMDHTLMPENEERVYFTSGSDNNAVYCDINITIVSMSESEVVFKAQYEIPMWTVFKAKWDFNCHLTVVPFEKQSVYVNLAGHYRALINGGGEMEKAKVRQMVNQMIS